MDMRKKGITARNIGVVSAGFTGGAIGLLAFAWIFFGMASEFEDSGYYYWSSETRILAGLARSAGFGFVVVGLLLLALGILFWRNKRTGKVCPKCEGVYSPTVTSCPICHTDLTHAMGVKEYLSVKPTAAPQKPTVVAPAAAPQEPKVEEPHAADGTPDARAKKFCSQCGHKISEGAVFCSNCGKKIP